jgi:hypothetical protein
MPVDLPPNRKPSQTVPLSWNLVFDRSLNWLAVIVGMALCLWVISLGA